MILLLLLRLPSEIFGKSMRACVLSGGGVRGAYQVGALKKWIYEDGIEYDLFCGISVGALNSAYLAQFKRESTTIAWKSLNDLWARVRNDNIKKDWFLFGKLASLWKPSVYNSEPLQEWVRSELDAKSIASSGKQLRVVAVSLDRGVFHVATESAPDIAEWVLASSSFPVMFQPVSIGGEMWTDGGIRSVTPLGEAIRLGATEIDVIMCSNPNVVEPYKAKAEDAIPDHLERALDLMSSQITLSDLQICGLKNDLSELRPKYRRVKVRLVTPDHNLIENSLDFDPNKIRKMIETGYQDACSRVVSL